MVDCPPMPSPSPECVESGAVTGEYPTLSNAPIAEALIDIRVVLPTETSVAGLEAFADPFRDRFTQSQPHHRGALKIEMNPVTAPVVTPTGPTPDGFVWTAPTENLIAQCRLDGFTLSKLRPYDSWRTFCPFFVECWNRYVQVAKPLKITRVALRYVNRLELPNGVDMKESILTVPEIGPNIPQNLPAFLMRLAIPNPSGEMAIVTLTSEDVQTLSGDFPIIFDIDVFRDVELEVGDPTLWKVIRDLRAYKNTIFFNSLTPKALDRYR